MIRMASHDDIDRLAEVTVVSWKAAYTGHMPDAFLRELRLEDRAKAWQRIMADPRTTSFVADTPAGITGYLNLREVPEQPGCMEISSLYVDPGSWRSGTGSALVRAAEDRARSSGCRSLILWVLVGNQRAIAFYEARGFCAANETRSDHRFRYFVIHEAKYVAVIA
jgi:ribosomal protein S18 acetylase RimI-like enzyme